MIDSNLSFLQFCDNEDLKTLCDTLTHNNKGELRFNEQLSETEQYKQYYPADMKKMWTGISMELQRYGGNTILNLCRGGEGVSYETILKDVCRKLRIQLSKDLTVDEAEKLLLHKYCQEMIGKMDITLLRELGSKIGINIKNTNLHELSQSILHRINNGDNKILIPVLAFLGVNISRILLTGGVIYATKGILGRMVGILCGPIGWSLTLGWLAFDVAGPAYRVTIPAVLQIACLRVKFHACLLPMEEVS